MDAIKIFTLFTVEVPQPTNGHDNLCEAYMRTGQKESAIWNYEQSFELNPKSTNPTQMLWRLRGGG